MHDKGFNFFYIFKYFFKKIFYLSRGRGVDCLVPSLNRERVIKHISLKLLKTQIPSKMC